VVIVTRLCVGTGVIVFGVNIPSDRPSPSLITLPGVWDIAEIREVLRPTAGEVVNASKDEVLCGTAGVVVCAPMNEVVCAPKDEVVGGTAGVVVCAPEDEVACGTVLYAPNDLLERSPGYVCSVSSKVAASSIGIVTGSIKD
jgi:hypothetical protein